MVEDSSSKKITTIQNQQTSLSTDDDDDKGYELYNDLFNLIEETENDFEKAKLAFHTIYGSNIIDEIVRANKQRRPTKSWRRSKSCIVNTTPIKSSPIQRSSSHRQLFDLDYYTDSDDNYDDDEDQDSSIDMNQYFPQMENCEDSPKSVSFFNKQESKQIIGDDFDPIKIGPRYLFRESEQLNHSQLLDQCDKPPLPTIADSKIQQQQQILCLEIKASIPPKKQQFLDELFKIKRSPPKSNSYFFEIYSRDPTKKSSKLNQKTNITW